MLFSSEATFTDHLFVVNHSLASHLRIGTRKPCLLKVLPCILCQFEETAVVAGKCLDGWTCSNLLLISPIIIAAVKAAAGATTKRCKIDLMAVSAFVK